ncbi:MAG TPA: helix-turn-helix domain-containing protein [Sphingomicrobium sp.]
MDYREVEPPAALQMLVKAGWTLAVPADGPAWMSHWATPDGCMEIIRRLSGRSVWGGEQPEQFVAGTITRPAELRIAAGSSFVGLRIWPWTWRLLTGQSPATLIDRWAPLNEAAPRLVMPETVQDAFDGMGSISPPSGLVSIAAAIQSARTAQEISARSGLSPRSIQRWFERNVGQPPRSYLRMLRFSEAFANLPSAGHGLADHALGHGFADQAHMSREFRALAGSPARQVRGRAQGPFIGGK